MSVMVRDGLQLIYLQMVMLHLTTMSNSMLVFHLTSQKPCAIEPMLG